MNGEQNAGIATELSRRKEEWRRMIAHDLRSPLSNILAVLQVINEIPKDRGFNDNEKELIEISLRSGRRMTELLDLFLDIAKLDEGVMPVNKRTIPILPIVRTTIEEQSIVAKSKRVSISVSCAETTTAWTDPELLGRVIQNLLNNSLKFTPDSGHIMIEVKNLPQNTISISVKDTGSGISPEGLSSLFDRFYQAQARREGRIQGNGLGLTFCREAIRTLGGDIRVQSEPGTGSEFTVTLPQTASIPDKVNAF